MPIRRINLDAIRAAVIAASGGELDLNGVAAALGVHPKSIRNTLPVALGEALGLRIYYGRGRGKRTILRVPRDRNEWSEPLRLRGFVVVVGKDDGDPGNTVSGNCPGNVRN